MDLDTEVIDGRIAAGIEWLNENQPGWVDRVDLATFNFRSCPFCAIGQAYIPEGFTVEWALGEPRFQRAWDEIRDPGFRGASTSAGGWTWAMAHGFYPYAEAETKADDAWEALNDYMHEAWKTAITVRQTRGAL